jgi:hypothetical protein
LTETNENFFLVAKSEAFNPVRTKPQVRAEIAGFIGEIIESRIANRGSTASLVRPVALFDVVNEPVGSRVFSKRPHGPVTTMRSRCRSADGILAMVTIEAAEIGVSLKCRECCRKETPEVIVTRGAVDSHAVRRRPPHVRVT